VELIFLLYYLNH